MVFKFWPNIFTGAGREITKTLFSFLFFSWFAAKMEICFLLSFIFPPHLLDEEHQENNFLWHLERGKSGSVAPRRAPSQPCRGCLVGKRGFEFGQNQAKMRPSESKPRPRRGKMWGGTRFQGLRGMDSSRCPWFRREGEDGNGPVRIRMQKMERERESKQVGDGGRWM